MITASVLRDRLHRRPFRPLRVVLSDGSEHLVPHPEFAWVFGGRVFVGVPGPGTAEESGSVKELAVLHISRIEDAEPA